MDAALQQMERDMAEGWSAHEGAGVPEKWERAHTQWDAALGELDRHAMMASLPVQHLLCLSASAAPTPTPWAPSTAQGAPCLVCDVVVSGLSPRVLPLHGVRAQRCGHLVLFRTKSRPRPRCGSPVQEQKRLPPRIPDESNRSPPGSRQKGGLCCVRACVCAGSGNETNMTIRACLCL